MERFADAAVEEDVEEEVEEEVVTVGEEVEMGAVLGAEVADGDVVELLALVVMLLILSVSVCVVQFVVNTIVHRHHEESWGGGSWANEIVTYTLIGVHSTMQLHAPKFGHVNITYIVRVHEGTKAYTDDIL